MNVQQTKDSVCAHLTPGAYPLVIDAVLDTNPGITDALTHCHACGQPYFLEMLDCKNTCRLFRLRLVDRSSCAGLLRDLDRGSCDPDRAKQETQHVRLASPLSKSLMLVDVSGPVIVWLASAEENIPGACWRELTCDGAWIERLEPQARV